MSNYLGVPVRIWAVWAAVCVALSAALVSSNVLPQPPQSLECVLLSVEPSGPEPSVTVWHSHWDCGGEWRLLEYVPAPEFQWQCGAVLEEGRWLEAACESVEELEERLAVIRSEQTGGRF